MVQGDPDSQGLQMKRHTQLYIHALCQFAGDQNSVFSNNYQVLLGSVAISKWKGIGHTEIQIPTCNVADSQARRCESKGWETIDPQIEPLVINPLPVEADTALSYHHIQVSPNSETDVQEKLNN